MDDLDEEQIEYEKEKTKELKAIQKELQDQLQQQKDKTPAKDKDKDKNKHKKAVEKEHQQDLQTAKKEHSAEVQHLKQQYRELLQEEQANLVAEQARKAEEQKGLEQQIHHEQADNIRVKLQARTLQEKALVEDENRALLDGVEDRDTQVQLFRHQQQQLAEGEQMKADDQARDRVRALRETHRRKVEDETNNLRQQFVFKLEAEEGKHKNSQQRQNQQLDQKKHDIQLQVQAMIRDKKSEKERAQTSQL